MDDATRELLAAERRGRELARRECAAGTAWELDVNDDGDGFALMAAARWAARLGAGVRVRLARPARPSPLWDTLTTSCRRQGMVDDSRPARGNALRIAGKAGEKTVTALPDDGEAWRTPLADAGPFVTAAAEEHPVRSCAQCREIDRKAIQDFSVPGVCLMENAAIAATAVAVAMLPSPAASVLVAVGGGNNGGDGLVVARGLSFLGIKTEVILMKPREGISGDAGINLRLLDGISEVAVHSAHDSPDKMRALLSGKDLVVDGLLGTGFSGALSPNFREAIGYMNASGIPILALDLPSGLNGDTGEAADDAVRATRTITFAAVKTGLRQGKGPEYSGTIHLGDIGAPTAAYPPAGRHGSGQTG